MDAQVKQIVRAFVLLVTLILGATAVSSAAAIVTEQQKRTPPISLAELLDSAIRKYLNDLDIVR